MMEATKVDLSAATAATVYPVDGGGGVDGERLYQQIVQYVKHRTSAWFPVAHQLLPAKAEVAREWLGQRKAGLRGWRLFCSTDKFRLPTGPAVASRRLVKNIDHFQSNYLCVFIVLLVYCILTSPMLLLAIAACLGMFYVIRVKNASRPLRVGGVELTPVAQYAIVAACSFPLFYIAGAGSVIFWVIGASIFVILLHALLYASEELPGEEFGMETV